MRKYFLLLLCLATATPGFSQTEKLDMDALAKIRNEGMNHSGVMDIAFYLTDASGPRLQGSPGHLRAANWAVEKMKSWGMSKAELEPWGNFGRSWELQKSYIAMTAPYYKPLIAFPKAWTGGTNGLQNAEILLVNAKDSVELETYRGKMAGKVIIIPRTDTLKPSYKPDAVRYEDAELDRMANDKPDTTRRGFGGGSRGGPRGVSANRIKEMAQKEGAVAILSMSSIGKDGTLFVSSGGSFAADAPVPMSDIMLAAEDYLMLMRLAAAKIPVKVEVEVKTRFYNDDLKGYNVIGEIQGTDKKLKEEVVMLGGHLDSWQGSTGATDNAAGCAVALEALRIIKASGLKPRRTIRIALWGGEEEGLIGSRNYVKNHFADPADMVLKPEHEKMSVYFNLDNGTGKIRGIYLQGNKDAGPIFTQWLEPFHDLGAKTVTIRNTGGTDHQAFDGIGLPGFQFIQDEIEYDTRTHHTTMDSYDHLQAQDLIQASTIMAAFVYNAAMRDEKIPRKALPKPRGNTPRRN